VGQERSRRAVALVLGTFVVLTLAGCGGGSSVSPTPAVTVPQAPTVTPATGVATSVFTANWVPSSGATSYRLDVSTSAFATFVTGYQDRDVGNATSWQVTGLTPNAAYSYRVRARNTAGTSDTSAPMTVTTLLTETCSGNLNSSGQAVCTFLITNDGHQVVATLTSLGGASSVGVAIGMSSGGTCSAVTTNDGATVGTRVVGPTFLAGTGCVRIYTPGNVPAPVTFAIAVEHW
jgi:Fibronectin type III domain